MGSFSVWHWAVVLAIVLLVFGTGKLKDVGGDLGDAVRDFKRGVRGADGSAAGVHPTVLPRIQDTEASSSATAQR